jgi:hypothetical protein
LKHQVDILAMRFLLVPEVSVAPSMDIQLHSKEMFHIWSEQ